MSATDHFLNKLHFLIQHIISTAQANFIIKTNKIQFFSIIFQTLHCHCHTFFVLCSAVRNRVQCYHQDQR